jgi:DNA polymerase-4
MQPIERAIVHLDLDAFFAAVEVLEDPELRGRPVIVGGRPEGRGVVTSASYEARAYGVRSAMPVSRALAVCPEAVVIPSRHQRYREYSRKVMAILHQAAPLMEQVSVDEAFLDLTDLIPTWQHAVEMAEKLQKRVKEETGLSASLGVATNKLVAKVASDQDKPGGLTVVRPGTEAAFLAPLSVRVLWGVGPVTAQKLARLEVITVGQLAGVPVVELRALFGRHGEAMARQALGVDDRPLRTSRQPKSIGHERTFTEDLGDREALLEQLHQLSQGVGRRLKRADLAAGTVAIKLRFADFTTLTRQMKLSVPTDDTSEIYRAAQILLHRVWRPGQRVRLLGVTGRQLSPPVGQLPLLPTQDRESS